MVLHGHFNALRNNKKKEKRKKVPNVYQKLKVVAVGEKMRESQISARRVVFPDATKPRQPFSPTLFLYIPSVSRVRAYV